MIYDLVDTTCPICGQPVEQSTAHVVSAGDDLLFCHPNCCVICSASEAYSVNYPRLP